MDRNNQGSARLLPILVCLASLFSVTAMLPLAPARAEKRLDSQEVEKGYIDSLALLAEGQREEALDRLMEVESDALGEFPSTTRIDRVWRLKLAVVRKARELTSDEILVPVIVFHHEAYERYRAAKQPVLARHARDMASDLAIYKVQSGESDDDKVFAGWVLASFGASLLDLRTSGTSASILQDALDMAPDNPAALMGLAWAHEIHGEYAEAIERLEVLVRAEPDNYHAQLRIAVCQQRIGELAEARRNLERVVANATVPWIRSVAYQELGRTFVLLEQDDKAESLARKALEEFPDDQELAILVASLSERHGRSVEAAQVLDRVVPSQSDRVSARYIYDSSPDLGIEEARETLLQMADERLGVLSSGLRWWGVGVEDQQTDTETGG